jgi:hypothetical protein
VSSIYLYADEASRNILSNGLQKIVCIGSDFGYGNFGDVLQHVTSLKAAKKAKKFVTVSVMAANAIGFKEFPACTRKNYGADAIIFVADYPLVLDDRTPQLELIDVISNLAAIYLYGGGFLNNMWGDYVLGITEHLLRLAPGATYVVSGQQITAPYQHRVVEHIKEFKPTLFGVRDELSQRLLREAGFNPDISFDDATEALLDLTQTLPLQRGNGLLMHVNASDYTAHNGLELGLGYELQQLKASRWGQDGVTLFQAFRDPRHEVCDARETLKKLDVAFPFSDLRLIELVSLVYGGQSGDLTNPIIGDIGYSCSYHVALWLQLAGIPCWLRSSNPFYDQKSRALQVTQELDSFLAEPRLADHRSNLERRAAWNERLQSFMLQIPEVFNTCTFTDDGKGPAPWPFFYKGKPTLQEKLLETEKSDRWQRDRAESSERDLGMARAELVQLHGRVEALTGQLTEVGNDAHRQRDRAESSERNLGMARAELVQLHGRVEALTGHIATIHASRSWRLTRGLRVLGRIFRGEIGLVRDGLRRAFKKKDS